MTFRVLVQGIVLALVGSGLVAYGTGCLLRPIFNPPASSADSGMINASDAAASFDSGSPAPDGAGRSDTGLPPAPCDTSIEADGTDGADGANTADSADSADGTADGSD